MEPINTDEKIKKLLFSDPSLEFKYVKQIIDTLSSKPESDKRALQTKLEGHIQLFGKKVKEALSTPEYDNYCLKATQRLREWQQTFGEISLQEVSQMAKQTYLKLYHIARDYITPQSLETYTKQYVKGQDSYVQKLSLSIYEHYLRIIHPTLDFPKTNLLVYGPTGSGKTYAVQVLTDLLGINFGTVNCNSVVQEGIVGQTLTDAFSHIYKKNNNNISSVEQAIILYDEFDKLFYSGYYNDRVLNELLNIIDDNGTATFTVDKIPYFFSTRNNLFIFTGVFAQLEYLQKKNKAVGFSSLRDEDESDFYNNVKISDFEKIIQRKELLGRIRNYAYVKQISAKHIYEILAHSEGSPLKEYYNYFQVNQIQLEITPEALMLIALSAEKTTLGVRGLKNILFALFADLMNKVGTEALTNHLVITKEYVKDTLKITQKQ